MLLRLLDETKCEFIIFFSSLSLFSTYNINIHSISKLRLSIDRGSWIGIRKEGRKEGRKELAVGMGPFIQLLLLSFFLLISAASTFIISEEEEGVFGAGRSGRSGTRNILQAKQNCPVNFESQDYSVITSECKGPHYPAKECCAAFKQFACPFSEQINDLSNNCASTMFSYINLAGKYPPGLFANECKEGKLGLICDDDADAQSPSSQSANNTSTATPSPLLLLGVPFIALLPLLFHLL